MSDEGRWILVLNTQKAGVRWFGTVLATDSKVAYRHNLMPLQNKNSIFFGNRDPRNRIPEGLQNVKEESRIIGIEKEPWRFSLADNFEHLSNNIDARVFVIGDGLDAFRLIENIRIFPQQVDVLRKHKFRVANLVMDPVRAIDALYRMWSRFYVNSGFFPNKEGNPFDEGAYQVIAGSGLSSVDDDIFVRASLHASYMLSRDAHIARAYGIPFIRFESLYHDRDYFSRSVEYLSDGIVSVPAEIREHLSDVRFHSVGRSTELFPASIRVERTESRDIFSEGKSWYCSLSDWRKWVISEAFEFHGIADIYHSLGYAFPYLLSAKMLKVSADTSVNREDFLYDLLCKALSGRRD